MKIGKVERYILDKIEQEGAILSVLIDPDKTPFKEGAKLAELACEAGADVILVGGSIGAQGVVLDKTTKMIREKVDIPIIIFPGSVGGITHYADAIFFMSLLNSRDVYWVSTAQIQAAPVVRKVGLEVIPTAYIVIEPGRAVGWIGNVNLVPRDRPDLAAAAALAGEYLGAHLVIFDSGSGAKEPVSPRFISVVKSALSIPLFYGGGCKTPEQVRAIVEAGADGITIGTAFELVENHEKKKEQIERMVKAVKEAGKKRVKSSGSERKEEKDKATPLIRVPRFLKFFRR